MRLTSSLHWFYAEHCFFISSIHLHQSCWVNCWNVRTWHEYAVCIFPHWQYCAIKYHHDDRAALLFLIPNQPSNSSIQFTLFALFKFEKICSVLQSLNICSYLSWMSHFICGWKISHRRSQFNWIESNQGRNLCRKKCVLVASYKNRNNH